MARKRNEDPARPYCDVRPEYHASQKAFEDAALMLHNMVGTFLSLAKTPEQAFKMINSLKEHNEAFRKAAYGDD